MGELYGIADIAILGRVGNPTDDPFKQFDLFAERTQE